MLDPKEFAKLAREKGEFVLDIETISPFGEGKKAGLDPHRGRISGVAVKCGDETAWYEVLKGGNCSWTQFQRAFLPLVSDPDVTMVGHNLKFDTKWLRKNGLHVKNRLWDTMIASWLCNENRKPKQMERGKKPSKYGLKKLVEEHFGHRQTTFSEQGTLFGPSLGEYAVEDVVWTDALKRHYEPDLAADNLTEVFHKIEMPLVPILAEMELIGMKFDPVAGARHREHVLMEMGKLEKKLYDQIGYEINLGSDKQIAQLLYEDGFLQRTRKIKGRWYRKRVTIPTNDVANDRVVPRGKDKKDGTPGQFSTKKEVLALFEADHPFIADLLKWRHYTVLLDTFIDKLIYMARTNPTHRIHGSFNQTGTRIGRLSSSEPNQQNVPRPDDYKDKANSIRGCFVAEDGNFLVDRDLSQIELRMMAHWSEDPIMMAVYLANGICPENCAAFQAKGKCGHIDIHTATAERLGIPRDPIAKCLDGSTIIVTNGELLTIQQIVGDEDPGEHREIPPRLLANGRATFVAARQGIVRHKRPTKIVVTKRAVVIATEDHRFQVLGNYPTHRLFSPGFVLEEGRELIEARYLEAGMELPLADVPTLPSVDAPCHVRVNPFTKEVGEGPATICLDHDWAYFAGMYAGDGSINKNACTITHGTGPDYAEWRQTVREALTAIGLPASTSSNGQYTRLGSKVVRRYLAGLDICDLKGEHGSKTMRIPWWVLSGGERVLWAYLAGLWDTDGTVNKKGTTSFTTKYPEFAGQIAVLLRALGLPILVQPQFNKGYQRWYFTVHVLGAGLRTFLEHCPIRYREKREALENRVATIKREVAPQDDKVLLVLDGGERTVYDVQVESEDHLYLQGGLIGHNNINFGACYRVGPKKLRTYAKVKTTADGRKFLQGWYDTYQGVVDFHEWVEHQLKHNAWKVQTITGRLRRLLIDSKINDYKAVTQGIQFIISGSSQDLLKIGMRDAYADVQARKEADPKWWNDAYFICQVHDQITGECRKEVAKEFYDLLGTHMEAADRGGLSVPIASEGGWGVRWTEAH